MLDKRHAILGVFECQQTGNCCRTEGVVYATPNEIEKMATVLGVSVHEFMDMYVTRKNGWFVIADRVHRPNCFLDKQNRCGVYKARPKACQTYPNWDSIWASEEALIL